MEQITYITGATATHLVMPNAKIDACGTKEGAAVIEYAKAGETFPKTATIERIEAKAAFINLEVILLKGFP